MEGYQRTKPLPGLHSILSVCYKLFDFRWSMLQKEKTLLMCFIDTETLRRKNCTNMQIQIISCCVCSLFTFLLINNQILACLQPPPPLRKSIFLGEEAAVRRLSKFQLHKFTAIINNRQEKIFHHYMYLFELTSNLDFCTYKK